MLAGAGVNSPSRSAFPPSVCCGYYWTRCHYSQLIRELEKKKKKKKKKWKRSLRRRTRHGGGGRGGKERKREKKKATKEKQTRDGCVEKNECTRRSGKASSRHTEKKSSSVRTMRGLGKELHSASAQERRPPQPLVLTVFLLKPPPFPPLCFSIRVTRAHGPSAHTGPP